MKSRIIIAILLLAGWSHPFGVLAQEFYVAPNGNDSSSGTKEKPFASLARAQDEVREYKQAHPNEGITVWLRGGIYGLKETVVFTLDDCGSESQAITYAAFPGETPVLSAGVPVEHWKRLENNPKTLSVAVHGKLWVADVSFIHTLKDKQLPSPSVAPQLDRNARILTLYRDGKPLPRARGSRFSLEKVPDALRADAQAFRFPSGVLDRWEDLSVAELALIPSRSWVSNILGIESVDQEERVARATVPPTYPLRPTKTHVKEANAWIENSLALLDEPGEWVHDSRNNKLYLWPLEGKNPVNITAPVLTELIRIEGKTDYAGEEDTPVTHLVFRGLTFTQGDRFAWHGRTGWGVQHDWERFDSPSAMMRLRGAEHCVVEDCDFTTAGSTGIRFDFHCQNNRVVGNHFRHLGGVGIFLGGYGPGTKNVNRRNVVENNLIHHIGEMYLGSPGIFVWQSSENRIEHNELHDLPYAGICVTGRIVWSSDGTEECCQTIRWHEIPGDKESWGYGRRSSSWAQREKFLHSRDNAIVRNDIHDIMQHCGDGNCIYISGAGPGNKVIENYCHDCPSRHMNSTIRCDDDQNDTLIKRNIIHRTAGDAEGFLIKGRNDVIENLLVDLRTNSGRHRGYMRFYSGTVESSVIRGNVFYSRDKSQNVNQENPSLARSQGGRLRDTDANRNVYFCEDDPAWGSRHIREQNEFGIETNSLSSDPLFENIDKGIFRFKLDSPALKLGIEQPLSIKEIGLREPHRTRLRAKDKMNSHSSK